MSAFRASLVPFVLAAALISCSTPEAPYTRVIEPLALPDTPRIYIVANRDSHRVVESLGKYGLEVSKGLATANLLLRVHFGTDRAQTYECGQVRNVKYELSRANRQVLWIEARGPTGRCDDNVIDKVTYELAQLIGVGV